MKVIKIIVVVFIFSIFQGCMSMEEHSMTLSFWTDRDLSDEKFTFLYANETLVGAFEQSLNDPSCNDSRLLDFKNTSSEDLNLTVRNEQGTAIDIGVINLYSVSTGIKIRPSDQGEIFVSQTLDDTCTLIRINWN